MYDKPTQISMNVIRIMEGAVKYVLIRLVAINVLVKKVTHWISMVLIALVCMSVCK